ncbi:MAG: FtsX-like permease family protein [Bythopirellula sp.]
MKTPLAWKNLTHNRVRTAIGVAGVGFAVILIFMQMGFKGAIRKTATQIYDALDFDLMLRSPAYLHLTEPRAFPRSRMYQAASLPEVTRVRPFYLGLSEWQAPVLHGADYVDASEEVQQRSGQWRGIITMGTEPADPAFVRQEICSEAQKLTDSRFVIVDDKSKAEYGPTSGDKFSPADIGIETSLGPNRIKIVGLFTLGTGMASNGACLTNPEGYVRACPWQAIDEINFGLLQLADPASAEAVKRQLQQMFGIPESLNDDRQLTPAAALTNTDVEILTRAEVNAVEEHRWVVDTPLGQIFTLGVWVAMFVGVAIVYQVLSTDIANMMGEYATLKAMGYSNRYLTNVVLQQSVLLALVGYVPSIIISRFLYWFVEDQSGMPMFMTTQIAFTVLMLAIGICVISGMAALRKLYQADPADLF